MITRIVLPPAPKVTFNAGGKTMRVLMEAASVRNPFARNELAGFHCAM